MFTPDPLGKMIPVLTFASFSDGLGWNHQAVLDGGWKTQPQIETHGPNAELQVNPVARMAEGGTETQQCSAWVAQREDLEDGLPGRTVQ